MNIKILSFGKFDQNSYGPDIERYLRMMKPWSKVENITFKTKVSTSVDQKQQQLSSEAELLRRKWPERSQVCSLAEEGKLMNTIEFANWLEDVGSKNNSIIFNFGSAYGLDDSIKKESDSLLSLSPMTMPYKLSRLVFIEQLYRALAVIHHHPYHKD